MNVDLLRAMWELSEWQLKWNPVDRPIDPTEYIDGELPQSTLRFLPSIFALFRMPPSSWKAERGIPPTHSMVSKAFAALMLEVENRWNSANPDAPVEMVTKFNSVTGQPEKCAYTLHGLRVRGITNLHRAGVPIEIISKMVAGHATVAMTLYYLLFEPAEISSRLTAAMATNHSSEVTAWIDELKNMKHSEARRRTTYVDESSVAELELADQNIFSNVDIGVCPFGGERCHDGGELIRADNNKVQGNKNKYGAVRGGARNCIMCRHLLSGTPFILPLELFGSSLLAKRNRLAGEQNDQRIRLRDLHAAKVDGQISKEVFRTMADRLRAENITLKNQIEAMDEAIFRVTMHLNAASKILKEDLKAGREPGVALVASDTVSAAEFVERSPFEMAAILTKASRFWSILKDDGLEQTKRHFIDQIMWRSGEAPISLRADLSEQQRQVAGDVLADYLLQRVTEADRHALIDGSASLRDLRLENQVKALLDDIVLKPVKFDPAGSVDLLAPAVA